MKKIKAIWQSDNPFLLDVNNLKYSKTVDVPNDVDMDELKAFAIKDSRVGYHFLEFEIL